MSALCLFVLLSCALQQEGARPPTCPPEEPLIKICSAAGLEVLVCLGAGGAEGGEGAAPNTEPSAGAARTETGSGEQPQSDQAAMEASVSSSSEYTTDDEAGAPLSTSSLLFSRLRFPRGGPQEGPDTVGRCPRQPWCPRFVQLWHLLDEMKCGKGYLAMKRGGDEESGCPALRLQEPTEVRAWGGGASSMRIFECVVGQLCLQGVMRT